MIEKNDNLILKMATMLAESQLNSKTIIKAMHYICDNFNFNISILYEIDQQNKFHNKEIYNEDNIPTKDNFYLEDISSNINNLLNTNSLLYITNEDIKNSYELEVLKYFNCHSIALIPIKTDIYPVQGFIVFLNISNNLSLCDNEIAILSSLVMLLKQYLNARIYQNMINFTRKSMEAILDHAGIDIYVNDFYTHDILYINHSMAAPYGGVDKFAGKKCWEMLFPGKSGQCDFCPQKHLIDDEGNPTKVYSWDYKRAFDGSWFRVFSSAFRWTDGRLAHIVCSADITDNKKNEELIEYMANFDALTNLPNRRKLLSDYTLRINNLPVGDAGYILFFDIDEFKKANDEHGHDAGDELLIQLSDFLSNIPLLKDSIYRNGGDEFVAIIIGEKITKNNIVNLISFIHERFKKTWKLKNADVYCNTSIGIACYPEDGTEIESLLAIADNAMYIAKKEGCGKMYFANEILNNI